MFANTVTFFLTQCRGPRKTLQLIHKTKYRRSKLHSELKIKLGMFINYVFTYENSMASLRFKPFLICHQSIDQELDNCMNV